MDRLTKEQRHKNMQKNKSKGTKIELLLGKMLWNAGVRYRKNDSTLPGTPDFSLRGSRVAIFCDGVFWHGRNWEERKNDIKSNRDYWYPKIERNIKHDAIITQRLEDMGWKVFRFWEDDIRHYPDKCLQKVTDYIHSIKNDRVTPETTYGKTYKKISVYGPHSFNRDGSIMSVSDQIAVVSHYLHNYGYDSAESFHKEASGLLEDIKMDSDIDIQTDNNTFYKSLSDNTLEPVFPHSSTTYFTFADLFSGIGGMRLGLEDAGGRCIYASDWDSDAKHVYFNNFGEAPFGDITKEETKQYLPRQIDLLCASLPLQRFALIKHRNVWDKIKGTLFYDTAEIIRIKNPSCILLEFPKSQKDCAKGTFCDVLCSMLENELGYFLKGPKILDTSDFGSAQEKALMYIVAFREKEKADKFEFPKATDTTSVFEDVMEINIVSARFYLKEKTLRNIKSSINAFKSSEKIKITRNTLIADTRTTDILPSTNKLDKINRSGIRRITMREHARLEGFPDKFAIGGVSEQKMHDLFNSSSPVNIIKNIGLEILKCCLNRKDK